MLDVVLTVEEFDDAIFQGKMRTCFIENQKGNI